MSILLQETKSLFKIETQLEVGRVIDTYGIMPWPNCKFIENNGWELSAVADEKVLITYDNLYEIAIALATIITEQFVTTDTIYIYGIPRGGVPCACILLHALTDDRYILTEDVSIANIIIDDVVDSGNTRNQVLANNPNAMFYSFFVRPSNWVVFPYEGSESDSIEDAYIRLSQFHNIAEAEFVDFVETINATIDKFINK